MNAKIKAEVTVLAAGLSGWIMTSRRPSLLLVVVANSILWALLFAMAGELSSRTTMQMFGRLADDHFWATLWGSAAVYQITANIYKRQWCVQTAAGLVAFLNLFSLILITAALWPNLPALLGGQVCVTLAAILLYWTGERRKKEREDRNGRDC